MQARMLAKEDREGQQAVEAESQSDREGSQQLNCRLMASHFTPTQSTSHQWITVTVTKTHVNNSVCLRRCSFLVLIIQSENFSRTFPAPSPRPASLCYSSRKDTSLTSEQR